jgi:hypothetical protein
VGSCNGWERGWQRLGAQITFGVVAKRALFYKYCPVKKKRGVKMGTHTNQCVSTWYTIAIFFRYI